MRRRTKLAILSTLAGVATAASSALAASPAIGRWNITIDTPRGPKPCWLEVEQKGGKFEGRFLHVAGSVHPIGEVKVDGNTIAFSAGEKKWKGKIDGDKITGESVDKEGTKGKWVGKRSVSKVDLNGVWVFHAPNDDLFADKIAMEITHEDDELEGELEGLERTASDLELEGDDFLFYIDPGFDSGESGRGIKVKVKGDKMVGTVMGMDGTEAKFSAKRERKWGKPIELFNGKNLEGWKPHGSDNFQWKAIDGVMENLGGGGAANIVTEKKFRDFKLHVEFKVPKDGNSGIYLRGRHEIQVSDNHGKDPSDQSCGSLYSRIKPATNASKPAGEWQTYDITLVGSYVTVVHNGRTVIDNAFMEGITGGAMDSEEDKPGPIYIQGDHGKISYRKFTITPAESGK